MAMLTVLETPIATAFGLKNLLADVGLSVRHLRVRSLGRKIEVGACCACVCVRRDGNARFW